MEQNRKIRQSDRLVFPRRHKLGHESMAQASTRDHDRRGSSGRLGRECRPRSSGSASGCPAHPVDRPAFSDRAASCRGLVDRRDCRSVGDCSDQFEQDVRDAARQLGQSSDVPGYEHAYRRGTLRLRRKRAAVGAVCALALFGGLVSAGQFDRFRSTTIETDEVAIPADAIPSTPVPPSTDDDAESSETSLSDASQADSSLQNENDGVSETDTDSDTEAAAAEGRGARGQDAGSKAEAAPFSATPTAESASADEGSAQEDSADERAADAPGQTADADGSSPDPSPAPPHRSRRLRALIRLSPIRQHRPRLRSPPRRW